MRLNWRSFWTKLGVGSGNKRTHLDENVWNNRGHWDSIMRQSQYHASSFRHSPFVSGKPFIPEQFTHHMWFHSWSLRPALVGASRRGSGMPPIFWEPQEGQRCFEGSHYPEYRRWYSLQSEGRSVHLYLHRTHTDRERRQCTPAHFLLCGLLSFQTQTS